MIAEDRIDGIVAHLQQHEQQAQAVLDKLREFTALLYHSFEQALDAIRQKGISQSGSVRQSYLGNGFKSVSFDWRDFRVVIYPYLVAALPNKDVSLPMPEELAGRIVYFYQPKSDNTIGSPLGEIYVYPNGRWYGFGVVGRVLENEVSEEKLTQFAITLLGNITYNFTSNHRSLEDTPFDTTPQGANSLIGFNTRSSND